MFHFFDGPTTAREIGFTNGDGGFQTEVGFADLAIGVLGILCARFRDGFLLAAGIAVSISYLGDAYGHLHQAAIHDNHAPDNTGLTLWADFIAPLVAIALYTLWRRFGGGTGKALKEALRANPPDDTWANELRELREGMDPVTDPWDD